MSDTPGGPGWWLASDGRYYPPDTTPGTPSAATPTTSPPPKLTRKLWWKRWWAIVLASFLILLVLGALFGEDPEKDPSDVATSNATTTAVTRPEPTAATTTIASTTSLPSTLLPSQTLQGTGKEATGEVNVTGGLTIFRMHHDGARNFVVELVDPTGRTVELLANVIGDYDGSTGSAVESGRYTFRVDADGPWVITVEQPRAKAGSTLPQRYEGGGPLLVGPFQGSGGNTRFDMHHEGDGNFVVMLHDGRGRLVELLANEIGTFDGSDSARTGDDPYYLKVEASGPWSIDVTKP